MYQIKQLIEYPEQEGSNMNNTMPIIDSENKF